MGIPECGRAVKRADERRRHAAGLFYFQRLRQRRAPLAAAGCRSLPKPQPQRRPPDSPHEANGGDANEGLALLESLVEVAFSADTRRVSCLESVANKDIADWDGASRKLGVFPALLRSSQNLPP